MPDPLTVLLDQNVPPPVAVWLRRTRPAWTVFHTRDVDLNGKSDADIFAWAQDRQALVMTFDEDFADRRSFPVGRHHGIVRLHVWPTTIQETEKALGRLLREVADADLAGALVIVDRTHIRLRSSR